MDAAGDGSVSIKQIKLKVLYTFDKDNKNNHLARWSQSVEVQTASIDETTVIGIISLRTCLEAVLIASPELAPSIESDYTIYAYDYSEPDTPLVGQGLLSKSLSENCNEGQDNEAMVTGRITKNVMGLFSKNAQETLEVKLRFTPVAAGFQRRRAGSISSNPDNVQQQWNSLSQSNGVFRPSSPMDTSGLEQMQRMLNEGGPRSGTFHHDPYNSPHSRPTSRSGTPTQSQHFNPQSRQVGHQSRPSSRSGSRQTHVRRDSFNSGYYSGEDNMEEGPVRKRAKIQKVDWPSKSNLNIERQPESLRVAASIASSVRLHRPVPQYATIAAMKHNGLAEEPVRPPTPIPNEKPKRPRGRPRKVVSSNLLLGPKARQSSPAFQQEMAEPSLSSPEDVRADSITSTPAPMDLPSSPPVMPEHQNFVTSPALPPMMNDNDSGFMSGNLDDLFEDEQSVGFGQFFQDRDLPELNFDGDTEFAVDSASTLLNAGNIEQPSVEMPPPNEKLGAHAQHSLSRSQSMGALSTAAPPKLQPLLASKNASVTYTARSQNGLPPVPASDPVGRSFQRSNTWAPDMSDAIMSDFGPQTDEVKIKPKKRVGKEQTKARLENAIALGEMPPFCDNCGSIETPAWRRAYTKIFTTPYDEFQTSLEPGECCYKEPVEYTKEGSVKSWKGYRTDVKGADTAGWTQICLCNPCGLWFHKSKYPRPPEKWQKRDQNEKRGRKRKPKPKKRQNRPIVAKSDALTPASDDSSPADTTAEGGDGDGDGDEYGDDITVNEDSNEDSEPQLPPMPTNYRAGSAEPVHREHRNFAARRPLGARQVMSSPLRATYAPITCVAITPQPVRRQLFPSPTSLQNKVFAATKTVTVNTDTLLPAFLRRSPRLNKTRDVLAARSGSLLPVATSGEGKENFAPSETALSGLVDLFDGMDDNMLMPPSTPTPKRRSERILQKTPAKTPCRETGGCLSHSTHRQIDVIHTPKSKVNPAASILISTVQRNLNPSEMTPYTRSIHDALNNEITFGFPSTPRTRGSARSKRTPQKPSPPGAMFDFPDLPTLKGSSPSNGNLHFAVNFSELPTDRLNPEANDYFGTDSHMPSSPPPGYFNFVEIEQHELDALWDLPDCADTAQPAHDEGTTQALDVASTPRRSLRKHSE